MQNDKENHQMYSMYTIVYIFQAAMSKNGFQ